MRLKFSNFKGMMPIIPPVSLGEGYLTNAVDCDFQRGSIKPFRTNKVLRAVAGDVGSIFETACCIVTGTVCQTFAQGLPGCKDMVFRAGDGKPQAALVGKACLGDWCDLGFPCPLPAVALSSMSPANGRTSAPTAVVYTLVSNFIGADGEPWESQPSAPSNIVESDHGATLIISGIPAFAAQCNIKEIRIYASRAGFETGIEEKNNSSAGFFLRAIVPVGTTSTSFACGNPGALCTTLNYESWPEDARDINSWRTGQLSALSGNKVIFSIKNHPHAIDYTATMAFYGCAIRYITGTNHGYVLTDGSPFIISLKTGDDGVQCHAAEHLAQPAPCVSARSAVVYGDTVIYATKRGLMSLTGGSSKELQFWSERQWQEMRPDTIIGAVHDGHYFGFTETHSFRISLRGDPEITYLSESYPQAAHGGMYDRLYIATASNLEEWNEGDANKTAIAERRGLETGKVAMAAVKIHGQASNVTIYPGCNHSYLSVGAMRDCSPKRFSALRVASWGFKVETKDEVFRVDLATGLGEL
jgi:hypothetical protein